MSDNPHIEKVAEIIGQHRLEVPRRTNWDTKWRCICDPSLEFVTKREQALHVAEAAIAALDPKCPSCHHRRSGHDNSYGCCVEREFEGNTFICGCGVRRYCITDAGDYLDPNGVER